MNWARSIRFDGVLDDAQRKQLAEKLPGGATLIFNEPDNRTKRTYGLVEGAASVEPAEAQAVFPDAHWYDEAIIALAIEPTPPDALPVITNALSGAGGPSGVLECTPAQGAAIVEFLPSRAAPSLILALADVELRRMHGYRKVTVLNPLPVDVFAKIAAEGLQAPEIGRERILEALVEQAGAD